MFQEYLLNILPWLHLHSVLSSRRLTKQNKTGVVDKTLVHHQIVGIELSFGDMVSCLKKNGKNEIINLDTQASMTF